MSVLCIIPARGGSKRLPGKNIMPLAGLPVLAYSVLHARNSAQVDAVVVTTDDDAIAQVARNHGADVIERPADLANDTATSESALLHALDAWEAAGNPAPELVVFLQCTSPARRADDIDNAIAALRSENVDAVFSTSPQQGFVWGVRDGEPYSLTYDWQHRKRGQDMEPRLVENGSIYVFRPDILRETGNRMGGRIRTYDMDAWSRFEIDSPEDAELLEWIVRRPEFRIAPALPETIDLVVFDFDGVMTDNTLLVDETGRESVRVNRADGLGLDGLRAAGVRAIILSTEKNPVVAARAKKLQLEAVHGVSDKGERLAQILREDGLDPANVIYVGNDLNDLGCFAIAGCPVAVADAHPDIRARARITLSANGGAGAVRELCDMIVARLSLRTT